VDQLSQNFGDAGTYTVTATASDPHGVAVSCNTGATVVPADQTITFGLLSNLCYGAPDIALSGTDSSGLTVGYTPSGARSLSGI
jgi:hypothetical protein